MSIRVSTDGDGATVYEAHGPAGPGAAFWFDKDGRVCIELNGYGRIMFGDLVAIVAHLKRDQHTPAGVVEVPAGTTNAVAALEEFRRALVETVGHPIEIRRQEG